MTLQGAPQKEVGRPEKPWIDSQLYATIEAPTPFTFQSKQVQTLKNSPLVVTRGHESSSPSVGVARPPDARRSKRWKVSVSKPGRVRSCATPTRSMFDALKFAQKQMRSCLFTQSIGSALSGITSQLCHRAPVLQAPAAEMQPQASSLWAGTKAWYVVLCKPHRLPAASLLHHDGSVVIDANHPRGFAASPQASRADCRCYGTTNGGLVIVEVEIGHKSFLAIHMTYSVSDVDGLAALPQVPHRSPPRLRDDAKVAIFVQALDGAELTTDVLHLCAQSEDVEVALNIVAPLHFWSPSSHAG